MAQTYQQIGSWGGPGGGGGNFNRPQGVAVDRDGNVYVSDDLNCRVQKFSPAGTFITMWGAKSGGTVNWETPLGIATDTARNVYVAPYSGNVMKFASDGTYLNTLPISGTGVAVARDGSILLLAVR